MALREIAKAVLPVGLARWLMLQRRKHRLQWPRAGSVNFGDFDRLTPISSSFGLDRGQPIDRRYIEAFLGAHASDIRGRALEMGDATYIRKFGRGVERVDVLHYVAGNAEATIVGDLTDAPHIPANSFDCIVFTQTLQMIIDMEAALATLHRILKPAGVALITASGISKVGRRLGRDGWGEYWRLTGQSMQAQLANAFPGGNVRVETYGNVFAAVCFLEGIAAEELLPEQLDYVDPDFEVIVAARAEKARA